MMNFTDQWHDPFPPAIHLYLASRVAIVFIERKAWPIIDIHSPSTWVMKSERRQVSAFECTASYVPGQWKVIDLQLFMSIHLASIGRAKRSPCCGIHYIWHFIAARIALVQKKQADVCQSGPCQSVISMSISAQTQSPFIICVNATDKCPILFPSFCLPLLFSLLPAACKQEKHNVSIFLRVKRWKNNWCN